MALSYKKDLDKYKDLDEDEILNKLSAEELKQLETALEEMDPEVRARWGLEELQGSLVGRSSCRQRNILRNVQFHNSLSIIKVRGTTTVSDKPLFLKTILLSWCS